jgi:hypothetical protein
MGHPRCRTPQQADAITSTLVNLRNISWLIWIVATLEQVLVGDLALTGHLERPSIMEEPPVFSAYPLYLATKGINGPYLRRL